MTLIKEISVRETFIVRHPVLRKGKPVETCAFEADDLKTTHYFGLFDNSGLTGIILLFLKTNTIFAENLQAQISVLSNLFDLIWFNTRTSAVEHYLMYKKL